MAELQVRDLTPAFGTEITGLDADEALEGGELADRLRSLFDTRGVLVFRDLDIDERTQADLIRLLIGAGPLAEGESPNGRADGSTFYVSNKEENGGAPFGRLLFHSDMMWSDHTFQVLSLYAVDVEPGAPGTLFASAAHAWATIPEDLGERVTSLTAVQGHAEHEAARGGHDPDVLITTFENLPTRVTDVAHRHPRTDEQLLYVSQQMTQSINDLSPEESEALLEALFEHLYREELLYEHEWRNHDLVAWDNIAIQHARPNVSLDGPTRTLRKLYAPLPPRTSNPKRPTFASAG